MEITTAGDPHKTIISGQGIEDPGNGNFYGSYGFLELNANSNYTGSARRIAITNGLDANKFAIIRSDTNMGYYAAWCCGCCAYWSCS